MRIGLTHQLLSVNGAPRRNNKHSPMFLLPLIRCNPCAARLCDVSWVGACQVIVLMNRYSYRWWRMCLMSVCWGFIPSVKKKTKKCMQLNDERGFETLKKTKKNQTYSLPFCLVWLAGCKSGERLEKSQSIRGNIWLTSPRKEEISVTQLSQSFFALCRLIYY